MNTDKEFQIMITVPGSASLESEEGIHPDNGIVFSSDDWGSSSIDGNGS